MRRNVLKTLSFGVSCQGFNRSNMNFLQTVCERRCILFHTNSCMPFWHVCEKLSLLVSARRSYYCLLLTRNAFTLPVIYVARNKN